MIFTLLPFRYTLYACPFEKSASLMCPALCQTSSHKESPAALNFLRSAPGLANSPSPVLSCRLLPSGSGEVNPPHAVRAVHRVLGAPFGSAAQQQRRKSRRGSAACLHPGSHQTSGFLLQVHVFHEICRVSVCGSHKYALSFLFFSL